jgi:predicted SAM-dependent methyltransferase
MKAQIAIRRYLNNHATRKLQIGAGPSQSEEWLTTDLLAKLRRKTVYLDATKPFPFPDASLDYVFSEHMIEHIPFLDACHMLRECHRVLKPGGGIRLATPDLAQLLALHVEAPNIEQSAYIAWTITNFLPKQTPVRSIHVLNNQFRNYGHQFLFDEPCLREVLSNAGFVSIQRFAVGHSNDTNLCNLEKHGINISNEAMNVFETMVLEALKPA